MVCLIIYLVLEILGVGFAFGKHGEYYKINGWAELIDVTITLALLYGAGLFDKYL